MYMRFYLLWLQQLSPLHLIAYINEYQYYHKIQKRKEECNETSDIVQIKKSTKAYLVIYMDGPFEEDNDLC